MIHSRKNEGMVGIGAAEDVGDSGNAFVHVGTNALAVPRAGMEVRHAVEGGMVAEWQLVSKLMTHVMERMRVDVKETPILLSEPSFNSNAQRERATQVLFEEFESPALFLAKSAVLTSFAHGRSTSVVFESGASHSAAVPVHDGYVISKGIVRHQLAGDELTRIFEHVMRTELNNQIRPLYSFSKKAGANGDFSIQEKQLAGITSSFNQYHISQIVQDAKESTTRVLENELDVDSYVVPLGTEPTPPALSYTLPDNSIVTPNLWRHRLPEIMFNPEECIPKSYAGYAELSQLPSVHGMMAKCINSCDTDLKKDLHQNVIFSGGNTLFPGFVERAMSELSSAVGAQLKLKHQSLPTANDRKFSTFIGGSILASLGTFHQMWMSKQEYDEYGSSLVARKCP